MSSIKGVIGCPLAAAGALELATCTLAGRHGLIPPTANYEQRDPRCDLDYVTGRARPARLRCALINIHGMGGMNSSLFAEVFDP